MFYVKSFLYFITPLLIRQALMVDISLDLVFALFEGRP